MKKTLLATAIAGAMAFSAVNAQAATVYDQDGTSVDIYGRIAMGVRGGGVDSDASSNSAEFGDVYSRLGLRLSQQITRDLSAFGRLEWRFKGDENYKTEAFSETRQSYLGLKSESWGTIQGGNFDSIYNQYVSIPFDVYIDRGLEFQGHPFQSRGDSIAYMTPDLSGFSVALQGKHYSERGMPEAAINDATESTVAFQGAVKYDAGPVRVALGAVDDVVQGGGNDEMLYGVTASYEFVPGFSGRLGYETQDDSSDYGGGHDTWGVGMSYAINQFAFNLDYYKVDADDADDKRDSWSAGAYYNVTDNFQGFLELNDADANFSNTAVGDLSDDVYWLTGARYFF